MTLRPGRRFAVDYVWRRDLAALEADLAEDAQGRLRVYAIWPLVPEAQLALERIFWEDFSSGGDAGG